MMAIYLSQNGIGNGLVWMEWDVDGRSSSTVWLLLLLLPPDPRTGLGLSLMMCSGI